MRNMIKREEWVLKNVECDICGKKSNNGRNYSELGRDDICITVEKEVISYDSCQQISYDICPDCWEKLEDWIKEQKWKKGE